MAIIAPSFLASDFLHLDREVERMNESAAAWFHLDIMDGRFVPNISFGLPVVEHIRKATSKVLDVHLMIEEPGKFAADFKKAGADHLTVHYEACPHLHRNLQQIRSLGMKAGVAINPHTPVSLLEDILGMADIVLVMSVNPGFGGQEFIPRTYEKISRLKQLIAAAGASTLIEVDGGVTADNAGQLVRAGTDVLVAGSSVFHTRDPIAAVKGLASAAEQFHKL